MKQSILRKKTFDFAVKIVRLALRLQKENKEYVLSSQILRSGTSPGALTRESEFAQSRNDFISKISIGLKEANETTFFLELLFATEYIDKPEFEARHQECEEIKAMMISSVRTAKSNAK